LGEHYILSHQNTIIGRDASCTLKLNDPKLSRQHCQISVRHSSDSRTHFEIEIRDMGSRNGIFVNHERINKQTNLKNGDQIRIGATIWGLYLKFPEEVELENYLYKLATRDSTTGLVTKAFFESNLDFEFKRALRYKRPMAFVLMDLDHFKHINDNYGHHVGDEVLKKVGELIRNELRFEDSAIRFGGEEFALILPETTEQEARALVERIRNKLECTQFKTEQKRFVVTSSFGISGVSEHVATTQLLIELADKALYQAKEQGRNRIISASKLAS
jgi:diguanylate cyclase (GGDEF)-like protein